MSEWWYAIGQERLGPVPEAELIQLVREGKVHAGTLVWTQGRVDWIPAGQVPELASVVAAASGGAVSSGAAGGPAAAPPPAPQAYSRPVPNVIPAEYTSADMRSTFTWFWVLFGPGILLCLPHFAGIVFSYILLYRFWRICSDAHARTTPGKAVGFCFIPLFNFYWIFVAVGGLPDHMNRYCERHGIAAPKVSPGMATWISILSIVCWIPYVGWLAGLPLIILQILLWQQCTETACAVIEHARSQATRDAVPNPIAYRPL